MESERFYLTDTPLFFFVQVVAYVLSVTLAFVTACFAAYQSLTLYLPYVLTRLGGNTFKFPDYFYRVYGDDVTELGMEQWGYLISAVLVSSATFKYVAFDCPFKSTDDSTKLVHSTKTFFASMTDKVDAVVRIAKRMAAVIAEESKKID